MSKRGKLLGALGALAIVGVIGAGALYYFVIRNDSPDAVSIDSAVQAVRNGTPGAGNNGASGDDRDRALAGTWRVVPGGNSFVGYRVQEELAGIGSSTAVGRSSGVDGTLQFDGDKVTAVQITADLTQLKSDKAPRDGQLRRQAIETDKFPNATFASTSIKAKGGGKFDVAGKLTVKGTSKDIVVPIALAQAGATTTATGAFSIKRNEFHIGEGEWTDTSQLADDVAVKFKITLTGVAPL